MTIQIRRTSRTCHKLVTFMATASRKEELEKKIEALKEEARRLKIRLSCIDDQISDFVGDLRMLENDTEQNS